MNWIYSLMRRRNTMGIMQRMFSRMNMRNNRGTKLSLMALAVGAAAYGATRMTRR
jgi:hypothetical protein